VTPALTPLHRFRPDGVCTAGHYQVGRSLADAAASAMGGRGGGRGRVITAHPLDGAAVDSITGVDRLLAVIEAGVAIAGGLELDMILSRFVRSAAQPSFPS
jgi:hypothetical protein